MAESLVFQKPDLEDPFMHINFLDEKFTSCFGSGRMGL